MLRTEYAFEDTLTQNGYKTISELIDGKPVTHAECITEDDNGTITFMEECDLIDGMKLLTKAIAPKDYTSVNDSQHNLTITQTVYKDMMILDEKRYTVVN